MPRTSTPLEVSLPLASAWPSTSGIAEMTPCTAAMRSATGGVVGQRRVDRLNDEVAVEAEDLVDQLGAEAVHHRHDDDQRRDAEHDADEGEAGDDRDEGLAAAGAEIAPGDHPLETGERPRPDRRCRGLAGAVGRLADGVQPLAPATAG